MAFKTKADYYGLGSVAGLQITSATENKSQSTAEAKGEDGFTVAVETYGANSAPANDFAITNAGVSLNNIVLGAITTIGTDKFCLSSITINTSAGAAPTLSASGQQVEAGATQNCHTTLPTISVSGLHHAQSFGAFTLSGAGAHLTSCNLAVSGNVSTATKDGTVIAHDFTDARLVVTATIQVSDASYGVPTVTAADGWIVTAPLSETNSDADFPSYSVTLTKVLTADAS